MTRSQSLKSLLGATALSVFASPAFAIGTDAGTNVENTFSLSYTTGTETRTFTPAASTDFIVDRVLNVNVEGSTTSGIAPGSNDQTVVFTVTNNGNGEQGYLLQFEQEAAGDNFNTEAPNSLDEIRFYLEATAGDNDGVCNDLGSATLTTYAAATPIPAIAADAVLCVVVAQDIPAGALDTQTGDISLLATTTDAGTVNVSTAGGTNGVGTEESIFGEGPAGTHSGDADDDGQDSDVSTYQVGAANVTGTKTVFSIANDSTGCTTISAAATANVAGTFFRPGACVEYIIEVENTGSQNATAVEIDDVLPFETTYVEDAVFNFLTTGGFTAPAVSTSANQQCPFETGEPDPGLNCTEVSLTGGAVAPSTTAQLVIRATVK